MHFAVFYVERFHAFYARAIRENGSEIHCGMPEGIVYNVLLVYGSAASMVYYDYSVNYIIIAFALD